MNLVRFGFTDYVLLAIIAFHSVNDKVKDMTTPIISDSARQRITVTLFASQSLYSAATIMTFTLLPIIAADLGGSDSLAGIPSTMTLIGRAAAAYFIGWD
jgi:hypothetical protein